MDRGYLSGLRILLIEEDPIVALDLTGMLETAGAKVFLALNVAEGYELANQGGRSDFDLAILDTRIGRNGLLSLASKLQDRGVALAFYTNEKNRNWLSEQFPKSHIFPRQHDSDVFLSSLRTDLIEKSAYLN